MTGEPTPYFTEGLAEDCGYTECPDDGEDDGGIEALIDYKNACEETLDSIEAAIRANEGITLSEWLTRSVAG